MGYTDQFDILVPTNPFEFLQKFPALNNLFSDGFHSNSWTPDPKGQTAAVFQFIL